MIVAVATHSQCYFLASFRSSSVITVYLTLLKVPDFHFPVDSSLQCFNLSFAASFPLIYFLNIKEKNIGQCICYCSLQNEFFHSPFHGDISIENYQRYFCLWFYPKDNKDIIKYCSAVLLEGKAAWQTEESKYKSLILNSIPNNCERHQS